MWRPIRSRQRCIYVHVPRVAVLRASANSRCKRTAGQRAEARRNCGATDARSDRGCVATPIGGLARPRSGYQYPGRHVLKTDSHGQIHGDLNERMRWQRGEVKAVLSLSRHIDVYPNAAPRIRATRITGAYSSGQSGG
jgi:hypothetical protein